MKKVLFLGLVAAMLSACGSGEPKAEKVEPAVEAPKEETVPEPPSEEDVRFIIIPELSTIKWEGRKPTEAHRGFIRPIHGIIGFGEGQLLHGVVEMDMNSITCTDIEDETSNAKLVKHLKGEDFFGVEKYPTASFQLYQWSPIEGSENVDISGQLRIKEGVEDIISTMQWTQEGDTFNLSGDFVFNRTVFDIKYKSKSFFDDLGDKFIYDDVVVQIDAKFIKE